MSIIFKNFNNTYPKGSQEVMCECCAAHVMPSAIHPPWADTYFTPPGRGSAAYQRLPSKGIVVSEKMGDLKDLSLGDRIDCIDLGDGETLYIRSSLEEYEYVK